MPNELVWLAVSVQGGSKDFQQRYCYLGSNKSLALGNASSIRPGFLSKGQWTQISTGSTSPPQRFTSSKNQRAFFSKFAEISIVLMRGNARKGLAGRWLQNRWPDRTRLQELLSQHGIEIGTNPLATAYLDNAVFTSEAIKNDTDLAFCDRRLAGFSTSLPDCRFLFICLCYDTLLEGWVKPGGASWLFPNKVWQSKLFRSIVSNNLPKTISLNSLAKLIICS